MRTPTWDSKIKEARKLNWGPPPGDENPKGRVVPSFVLGEVIVMGRRGDLDELVKLQDFDVLSLRETRAGNLETRRYRFGSESPEDVMARVEQIRRDALDAGRLVVASPNYICTTEHSPDTFHAEGSPFNGEGSTFHAEGSPDTPPGVAPANLYWDQWAFGSRASGGIEVDKGGGRKERGSRSTIIILDTSCFPREGFYTFSPKEWIDPALKINVWHPLTSIRYSDEVTLPGEGARRVSRLPDESAHGLFVAGLAHGVAPATALHLIRVLDDHGHGEMAHVIYVLGELARAKHVNTVLNLSLGFVPVADPDHPAPPPGAWVRLLEEYGIEVWRDPWGIFDPEVWNKVPKDQQPKLADALQLFMLEAELLKLVHPKAPSVVIAAAAGNRSTRGQPPLEPQIPANLAPAYPALLAVAANDYTCEPAFYSQKGTIGAPGGGDPTTGCDKPDPATRCWRSLKHWMISLYSVRQPLSLASRTYTWGFWAGTSFATPLVSGIAAVDFTVKGSAGTVACDVYDSYSTAASDPYGAMGPGIALSFLP